MIWKNNKKQQLKFKRIIEKKRLLKINKIKLVSNKAKIPNKNKIFL